MLERLEKGYVHIQTRGDSVDLYRVGKFHQTVRQETFEKESVIEVLEQRKRIISEAEKTSKVLLGLSITTTAVFLSELLISHKKNFNALLFVLALSSLYANQQRKKYSGERLWVEKEIEEIKTYKDL